MRALALGLVLLTLAGCAVVRRPMGEEDAPRRRGAHVVLLLCIFASCHHIAHPVEPEPLDEVGAID